MTDGHAEHNLDRRAFMQRGMAQTAGALAAVSLVPTLSARTLRLDGEHAAAVIGCGRQGRDIIAELSTIDGVTIAALCDIDERRIRSAARRASSAETFTDHKAAIAKLPAGSLVFIATPTHLHREILEDAVAAGMHVYCEAPIAATVDDAKSMARTAAGAGTVVQAGYLARANPVYTLAWSFFRSDSVRDLVSIRAARHRKTSWRTPASTDERERLLNWHLDPELTTGLAGEWGSHQFDTAIYFTGRAPETVAGRGSVRLHEDGRKVADTITCMLGFDRGEVMTYEASLANSYEGAYELFRGTNAAIKLAWTHGWMFKEADAPTQGWEVYANRQQFHKDEGITLIAGATKLAEQGKLQDGVGLERTPLYYGVESFIAAAAAGSEPACTMADALKATVCGIRAHEAVSSNTTVKINPADLEA